MTITMTMRIQAPPAIYTPHPPRQGKDESNIDIVAYHGYYGPQQGNGGSVQLYSGQLGEDETTLMRQHHNKLVAAEQFRQHQQQLYGSSGQEAKQDDDDGAEQASKTGYNDYNRQYSPQTQQPVIEEKYYDPSFNGHISEQTCGEPTYSEQAHSSYRDQQQQQQPQPQSQSQSQAHNNDYEEYKDQDYPSCEEDEQFDGIDEEGGFEVQDGDDDDDDDIIVEDCDDGSVESPLSTEADDFDHGHGYIADHQDMIRPSSEYPPSHPHHVHFVQGGPDPRMAQASAAAPAPAYPPQIYQSNPELSSASFHHHPHPAPAFQGSAEHSKEDYSNFHYDNGNGNGNVAYVSAPNASNPPFVTKYHPSMTTAPRRSVSDSMSFSPYHHDPSAMMAQYHNQANTVPTSSPSSSSSSHSATAVHPSQYPAPSFLQGGANAPVVNMNVNYNSTYRRNKSLPSPSYASAPAAATAAGYYRSQSISGNNGAVPLAAWSSPTVATTSAPSASSRRVSGNRQRRNSSEKKGRNTSAAKGVKNNPTSSHPRHRSRTNSFNNGNNNVHSPTSVMAGVPAAAASNTITTAAVAAAVVAQSSPPPAETVEDFFNRTPIMDFENASEMESWRAEEEDDMARIASPSSSPFHHHGGNNGMRRRSSNAVLQGGGGGGGMSTLNTTTPVRVNNRDHTDFKGACSNSHVVQRVMTTRRHTTTTTTTTTTCAPSATSASPSNHSTELSNAYCQGYVYWLGNLLWRGVRTIFPFGYSSSSSSSSSSSTSSPMEKTSDMAV